jgi:hypothetical protein
MTRELDVQYSELCTKCKRALITRNRDLLRRMKDKYSYRELSSLTGIPRQSLKDFVDGRKSELKYLRTSGNGTTDTDKPEKISIDTVELSKKLKEIGQSSG